MADNVNYTNPTSGTPIATENLGGVQYQRIKIVDGTAGSSGFVGMGVNNGLKVEDASCFSQTTSNTINATGQTVTLSLLGETTVAMQASGVFVGTLQLEGTVNGVDWIPINGVSPTSSAPSTTVTGTGLFYSAVAGLASYRVRSTAWTSGTAQINIRSAIGDKNISLTTPIPTGSNVIGTVTIQDGGGSISIDDGGNPLAISDNAGSLTVDAPVGTPVFVRLSDGSAAQIGQKAMAASLPVTIASDQTVLHVDDNSGTLSVDDGAGSLTVDAPVGTPVYARLSDGTAALVGQKTMANSLPVTLASDQSAMSCNATLQTADNTVGRFKITDGTTVASVNATTAGLEIGGDVASGTNDAGSPVKIGGVARTTIPSAVTDAQRVNFMADKYGRQIASFAPRDTVVMQQTSISNNTENTILTAVAATFLDLAQLIITNSSTTAVSITIKDSTTGTTRLIVDVAANGGAIIPFPVPLPQATVNNNWTATVSSAVSTIHITAVAIKNV